MELVEVYEGPETHVGIVEQLLKDAGIPYVHAPGVSGYPMIEPLARLQVPADRAEEAMDLIRLGPAMPPPPPPEEREVGYTPELERPRAIVSESPEEARRLADEYLAAHPDDINAWDVAASIANTADDASAAEGVLRRGLKANPDHPRLRAELGHYLEAQGRLEGAHEIYESLVSSNPESPHGFAGLATIALRKSLHDDARSFAQQASDRLHPVYQPRMGLQIGLIWLELREDARALEILQALVNWFQWGRAALIVAAVIEDDPAQPEEVVDEAFDEARRYWDSRDGSWEEALEFVRKHVEERDFLTKFA